MCCIQVQSGTAFEGRLMAQPAIAVSLAGPNVRGYNDPQDFAQAAQLGI